MTKKRQRLVLAIVFFLVSLVCALIYEGIWSANPDYFMVSRETNLYPLETLRLLLWEQGAVTASELTPRDLGDLSADAAKIIADKETLDRKRRQLEREDAKLQKELSLLSVSLERNRSKRIAAFETREMSALLPEREQVAAAISILEAQRAGKISEIGFDSRDLAISQLKVELAQIDYKIAKRRSEVAGHIIREYGQFAAPEDLHRANNLENQVSVVQKSLLEVEGRDSALRIKMSDLLEQWRAGRVSRLDFYDFLYFSLGVSTTVTFGDIVPNHSIVRTITTLQILASVVLLGMFLNTLG